jgi:ACT domain-containing protein
VKEVSDEILRRLVAEVTRELAAQSSRPSAEASRAAPDARRPRGSRAVVTTTGKNQRGIVAKIAQAIADSGGDIVDISQTLVSDYFTMIIVVDASALTVSFADFKSGLEKAVAALGAQCLVMHEEVVEALQRV